MEGREENSQVKGASWEFHKVQRLGLLGARNRKPRNLPVSFRITRYAHEEKKGEGGPYAEIGRGVWDTGAQGTVFFKGRSATGGGRSGTHAYIMPCTPACRARRVQNELQRRVGLKNLPAVLAKTGQRVGRPGEPTIGFRSARGRHARRERLGETGTKFKDGKREAREETRRDRRTEGRPKGAPEYSKIK